MLTMTEWLLLRAAELTFVPFSVTRSAWIGPERDPEATKARWTLVNVPLQGLLFLFEQLLLPILPSCSSQSRLIDAGLSPGCRVMILLPFAGLELHMWKVGLAGSVS